MPPPPRTTIDCRPVTSQAKPMRGAHCGPRYCWRYLLTSLPASEMPFRRLPELGTILPTEVAGAVWPVTGSIAIAVLPFAASVGRYRCVASAKLNWLEKQFDVCSAESYCGCTR